MTIKERLRTYRDLILYIKQLESDIDALYSKAESLRVHQDNLGARVQSQPPTDPIGDIVSELADTALTLGDKIRTAKTERRAIEELIRPLPYRDKTLIHLRYFNGYSWEQVAVEMQYTLDYIWHLHGDILRELET